MQKKLERLNTIIRNVYASGDLVHGDYLEATKLLTELSNELKILNIPDVSQLRELLIDFTDKEIVDIKTDDHKKWIEACADGYLKSINCG